MIIYSQINKASFWFTSKLPKREKGSNYNIRRFFYFLSAALGGPTRQPPRLGPCIDIYIIPNCMHTYNVKRKIHTREREKCLYMCTWHASRERRQHAIFFTDPPIKSACSNCPFFLELYKIYQPLKNYSH